MEALVSLGVRNSVNAGLVFLSLVVSSSSLAKAPPSPPGPARPAATHALIESAPDTPGRYLLKQHRAQTTFTDQGITLQLTPPKGAARELHWGMAQAKQVTPQPLSPREAQKQSKSTWGGLYYPAVAPGVDLWLEARQDGVQYSLRAERGSDLREVRLEWSGAQELRLANQGQALVVKLADGELREEGLQCGQENAEGVSQPVPCRYREVRLRGANLWEYVIEVQVEHPSRPAWVDPTIQWNTFVGGSGDDALENLTVLLGPAIEGQFFFVGSSGTNGLPSMAPQGTTGTRFNNSASPPDVAVGRRNSDGTVLWTSILGGNGDDLGKAFAIGANGDVFVAGFTTSTELGTLGTTPSGTPHRGGKDGFIARISSSGDELFWVQYIGGLGDEEIFSLTLGTDGKLYAAGSTNSQQLPASDAGVPRGGKDLFVSRLHAETGAVERTLVLSGRLDEEALSITTGERPDSGTLYVTGYTDSPDFPLGIAPRTPNTQTDGGRESVVLKLNEQLATPLWGTFIGASTGGDEGRAVLFDSRTQRVMVVGTTRGLDFPNSRPTSNFPPGANAFLAAFEASNGNRTFSTFVGGSGDDEGLAITTGTFNSIYIGGRTNSPDLPVTPFGFDLAANATEGFVFRMGMESGTYNPEWGTYVGGSMDDDVRALGSGPRDTVLLIGGMTRSADMMKHTLRDMYDLPYKGGEDMYLIAIAALDLTPPVGVVRDGVAGDSDVETDPLRVKANWAFQDPEYPIIGHEFGVGTLPGCTDIVPFRSVELASFIDLPVGQGLPAPLEPGRWYFSTVTAKNEVGLTQTLSSDGYFLLLPDGGPAQRPTRPGAGPCPGAPDGGPPDAGVQPPPDGGVQPPPDGGINEPGKDSPLGWSCNCGAAGGPAGLLMLVLVALGLRTARRGD